MKYKKYLFLLLLLVPIIYITYVHLNIFLKFHHIKTVKISTAPYEITTIKNSENKNKIVSLVTNTKLKNKGKEGGKGFVFSIDVDNHFIEVVKDKIVIDGFTFISDDTDYMKTMFDEFTKIYSEESQNNIKDLKK